ncbi:PBP2 [[Candida] subhashii]|uniref:PBP2 n=1 Tax=[Candida] subhashii TaxID=561895 RepID=A0A8J5UX20_9ASCO|nr:PBP2 [[Candida] subhashii]KAG7662119.1 PBP2 [[Candida] subhashii]
MSTDPNSSEGNIIDNGNTNVDNNNNNDNNNDNDNNNNIEVSTDIPETNVNSGDSTSAFDNEETQSQNTSSSNSSNLLKRKNDEEEQDVDKLNKRVALDSEQLELQDKQQEHSITAPTITSVQEDVSTTDDQYQQHQDEATSNTEDPADPPTDQYPQQQHEQYDEPAYEPQATDSYEGSSETSSSSKPVSNHREKDNDPTYTQFRMYCPVKEASCIVGKKGEKINHLREKANVGINISDNLKNVPERIVTVKGSAENVARAFGLITRTILDEPEDEPASIRSQQYNLKLLVPHPMIGFIIGKQGLKFREIEESSAAKLKAAEQPLPYSTDRVLSVTGVADAIHIAVYYIAQVMLEHKDCLKKYKVIYYNPANYQHGNVSNSMMNIAPPQHQQQHPIGGGASPMDNLYGQPAAMGGMDQQPLPYQAQRQPYGQHQQKQQQQQPYNFQMMFQPSVHPQQPQHHQYGAPLPPQASIVPGAGGAGLGGGVGTIPQQTQYTDEHGNTIIGEVVTNPPVQVGPSPDKFNQDIFVANANIGSVIGRGGNNIKHIRENSGCTYVKIEPDRGQSIMLGGGRGLTNIRKLTLTGSVGAIQTAIYLINQRIATDKERNSR